MKRSRQHTPTVGTRRRSLELGQVFLLTVLGFLLVLTLARAQRSNAHDLIQKPTRRCAARRRTARPA